MNESVENIASDQPGAAPTEPRLSERADAAAALLAVGLAYRAVPEAVRADRPLLGICWRGLKREAADRERERQQAAAEVADLERMAGEIAAEIYRAQRMIEGGEAAGEPGLNALTRKGLGLALARIEQWLSGCGVRWEAPVGAPYEGDLLETLRNVAQQPRAGVTRPVVDEILAPAITIRGRLLRPGAAVIGVPLVAIECPPGPPAVGCVPEAGVGGEERPASEGKGAGTIEEGNEQRRSP